MGAAFTAGHASPDNGPEEEGAIVLDDLAVKPTKTGIEVCIISASRAVSDRISCTPNLAVC